VYGGGDCERWIGDWLAERDRRALHTIASKVYWQIRDGPNSRGTNRKNVRHRVDALLDRLDTDYLDVLYIHRWDDETPARELMKTLNGLVESGKVHYLGASTLRPNAWKVARANEIARSEGWPPSTCSSRDTISSTARSKGSTWSSRASKIWPFPVEPARSGFLTGKYDRDEDLPEESKAAESKPLSGGVPHRGELRPPRRARRRRRGGRRHARTDRARVARPPRRRHRARRRRAHDRPQLAENLAAASIDLSDEQVDRLTAAKSGPYDGL